MKQPRSVQYYHSVEDPRLKLSSRVRDIAYARVLEQIADVRLRPDWLCVQMFRDVPAQLSRTQWQHRPQF